MVTKHLWLLAASFGALFGYVAAKGGVMPSPDAEQIKEKLADHHFHQHHQEKDTSDLMARLQDQMDRTHVNATVEVLKMQKRAAHEAFKKTEHNLLKKAIQNLTNIKTLFPRKQSSTPKWRRDYDKVDARWQEQSQELHDEKMADGERVEIVKDMKLNDRKMPNTQPGDVQPAKKEKYRGVKPRLTRRDLQNREQKFAKDPLE
eukprot:gnl/MRDRNA2_/MRDRNA2_98232_c0_seq1.p1 gnl/MRDRNA2_/MRDRNA2_98232_c0~~gnl/MRDRNA2_/MRDRNA2_98232_c0_seq1.p1  ORF type:complete len:203 (+),score=60.75 gnl/MRDRNA2_/MRDRNA2_98232_c0_seq1:108-716(+)